MNMIGKGILDNFIRRHSGTKKWLENWVADTEGSIWRTPQDIKNKYPTASFLEKNMVIFNLKGNNYRLETRVSYKVSIVTVLWVGTHAEYDKRNAKR